MLSPSRPKGQVITATEKSITLTTKEAIPPNAKRESDLNIDSGVTYVGKYHSDAGFEKV